VEGEKVLEEEKGWRGGQQEVGTLTGRVRVHRVTRDGHGAWSITCTRPVFPNLLASALVVHFC